MKAREGVPREAGADELGLDEELTVELSRGRVEGQTVARRVDVVCRRDRVAVASYR